MDTPPERHEDRHGLDQEAMLRGLLDAAPIGIGLVKDRILGWVNPRFEAITGYTADDVAGRSARMLYPDEQEYERVGRIKHPQIEEHGVGALETRFQRKDGAIIDVLLSTAVLARGRPDAGFVFTVMDITEQTQATAALVQRERSLAALFANLPGMVYRCRSDRQWTMEFLSDGCRECTGLPPSAFIGNAQLSYADLILPADRDRVRQEVQTALARRKHFELEYRVKLPERGVRWFWERGCGLFADDGSLIALEGFIADITDYKELQTRSLQSSKLAAIGTLAGGIAHDFNNLLQVIKGYASLLVDDLAAGRPDDTHVQEILKASNRAQLLVGRLLAFSRRQILQPRLVNINALIENLFTMLARILGEDIELALEKGPDVELIEADQLQLEQLLMNLVLNARDAMPDGGRLHLGTRSVVLGPQDCLSLPPLAPGRHVKITVADTGVGMTADTVEKVFEPFFTTKEVGKGTGLGLATAYGIVQQHGGAITIASEPDAGTTFEIYLPACTDAAPTVDPSADDPAPEPAG